MTSIALGPVHFDPVAQAFEARVDVFRAGRAFRYPCRIVAPMATDPDLVTARLVRQALRMSDSPTVH